MRGHHVPYHAAVENKAGQENVHILSPHTAESHVLEIIQNTNHAVNNSVRVCAVFSSTTTQSPETDTVTYITVCVA